MTLDPDPLFRYSDTNVAREENSDDGLRELFTQTFGIFLHSVKKCFLWASNTIVSYYPE